MDPAEAQAAVREELIAETRTDVKAALVARAWPRIVVTGKITQGPLDLFVRKAKEAGFLHCAGFVASYREALNVRD